MRNVLCLTVALMVVSLFGEISSIQAANGIQQPVKGKEYLLTKRHGPWMIMVASLRDRDHGRSRTGLTAREAANQLVFELRSKGIPAYTFSQDDISESVATIDRLGIPRDNSYVMHKGSVSVLAGNYRSVDTESPTPANKKEAKIAQATLKWIKNWKPGFLLDGKSGAIFRKTPGKPGPLSGAFLTLNPMLTPEEVQKQRKDPLVLRLNSGEHSVYECPGKYTMIIASFYGKRRVVRQEQTEKANASFLNDSGNIRLNNTSEEAWLLAKRLISLSQEGKLVIGGKPIKTNVYIYHDRYRSLVTVGSFDSPDDPLIQQYAKTFGAKVKKDANGRPFLAAEYVVIPNPGASAETLANEGALHRWVLDPSPQLMEVPRP